MRALFIMYYFKMAIIVYNAHTRLFYFKKDKAQNAEKLRNIKNRARLRFRNLWKRILINQKTIFERKYLQNTTNETNVNMFIYKVYLTHFMCADDSSKLSVTVETP